MESAAMTAEVCICEIAHHELERGGDDLASWAKSIDGFVCAATDAELTIVADIANAQAQGQRNHADPFVIAHAAHTRRIIVTEETKKGPGTLDKNQKIPNIAAEYGITCITFFEFMRAMRWSF